jgi:hypothetical protein
MHIDWLRPQNTEELLDIIQTAIIESHSTPQPPTPVLGVKLRVWCMMGKGYLTYLFIGM